MLMLGSSSALYVAAVLDVQQDSCHTVVVRTLRMELEDRECAKVEADDEDRRVFNFALPPYVSRARTALKPICVPPGSVYSAAVTRRGLLSESPRGRDLAVRS